MAIEKITRKLIEKIKPQANTHTIYDTELKGFGVRVMPSGVASYIVEYRPGEGGRGVSKKRMVLGRINQFTPDEARTLAREQLGSVRKGEDPLLERETKRKEIKLSELIDQWEQERPAGRKSGKPMADKTLEYTLARLRNHVVPILGGKRVSAVTVDDVNDLIKRISKGETRKDIKSQKKFGRIQVKGGDGAARKVASDLSIIYGYAIEKRIVVTNPVSAARKPKAGKRHDYMRPEDISAIADALDQMEKKGSNRAGITILRLLLLTGARPSEIEGLKWSEIDFGGRCLRLEQSKTGFSIRRLSDEALAILEAVEKQEGSPYVFPATRGNGYFIGSKKLWNQAREIAGLQHRVRYHARHAFATQALAQGTDVASVAAMMGHKGPRTTLSTYAHAVDERVAEAVNSVSSSIYKSMKSKSSR